MGISEYGESSTRMNNTRNGHKINTPIVVISWWSNCLALACLHRLMQFTGEREIILVQVGKLDEQKKKLRHLLPKRIVELEYPLEFPAEHSRIIRFIVKEALSQESGLWFVDHDLLLLEAAENWLRHVETDFDISDRILALPKYEKRTPSITIPLFWVSPVRWPHYLEGFDPVPFKAQLSSKHPYEHSSEFSLRLPRMDTLEQACAILGEEERVAFFPMRENLNVNLPTFPSHYHLGGLNLFSFSLPKSMQGLNPSLQNWILRTTMDFSKFFNDCPKEWLAIEDPVLLNRLLDYQEIINDH